VRLVAGPSDVYICNLCVALCNEILAQERDPLIVTEVTSG
jgi:ATP-dependent protease Clp ATPase subunit